MQVRHCRESRWHLHANPAFALTVAKTPLTFIEVRPLSMSDLACHNDESSEDGSTSYSDFCDDNMIRGATTDATLRLDHAESSPPPSTNTAYSSQPSLLGKRKVPDGVERPVPGPSIFYSYKKRFLSDSIEADSVLGSSEATTLGSIHSDDTLFTTQSGDDMHDAPPYIIVRSVKIGPLRYH
jgi:hypothetical protein